MKECNFETIPASQGLGFDCREEYVFQNDDEGKYSLVRNN